MFESKSGRLVKRVGEEQLVRRCSCNVRDKLRWNSKTLCAGRYWSLRKAMKLKGIKSTNVTDIVSALLAKGVAVLGDSGSGDVRPSTSRFQSALAQRIAAANVMWGASDVVDFKVCMAVSPPVCQCVFASIRFCSRAVTSVEWRCGASASSCVLV